MGRTKAQEGRKAEFIDAAEALFNENGFENTSVEDIVQRVGVAKGLFYYYFESKESLMTAMVDRTTEEIRSSMSAVMAKDGLTSVDKLAEIIVSNQVIRERSKELIRWFREERDQGFHVYFDGRAADDIVRMIESIILQGIEEGTFHTDLPRESAAAALSLFRTFMNDAYREEGKDHEKAAQALAYLTERMLGAKEGTFGPLLRRMSEGDSISS